MNLLQFFEDPRGPEEKGRVVIFRGQPSFLVHIPPRPKRIVPVKVLEKSSETRRVKQRP